MCEGKTEPSSAKRLRISELNPHLLCALCGGYLIDATTIIECLHSFCKTCILRYLETSNYCPICEVLIHKTRPWQNIRLDHSLQNAVYKMVPGLFQNEMKRRREFYEKHKQEDKRGRLLPEGEVGDRIIFSQDEEFSISIEFSPDGKPVADTKTTSLKRQKTNCQHDKRYLKCPAALRIEHLKKFIRSKFSLPASIQIDLFLEKEPLCDSFTLMDVAYIYMWKRDCVLRLFYSFFEIPAKIRKVETVTLNSEKVSKKNKVTDKKDGTEYKQKEDRKTKNRKEKPRERKQTNITGKGEVTANQSTASQQPANHVASCEKNQIILSSHNSSCEKNNPVIPSHDVGCDKNQPISASHTTGNEKNNSVIASHNNGLEKNQPIRASHDSSCNKTQPVVISHDEGSTRNQPDLLMNCSNAHLKRKHSDTGQTKKSPSVVKQGKVPPQTNIQKQGKVPPQTNIQKQGKGPPQTNIQKQGKGPPQNNMKTGPPPAKQRCTSYSIVTSSNTPDKCINPKENSKSKTSLKMLIKSSDNKVSKTFQVLPTPKPFQNGQMVSITVNSNLFERMGSLTKQPLQEPPEVTAEVTASSLQKKSNQKKVKIKDIAKTTTNGTDIQTIKLGHETELKSDRVTPTNGIKAGLSLRANKGADLDAKTDTKFTDSFSDNSKKEDLKDDAKIISETDISSQPVVKCDSPTKSSSDKKCFIDTNLNLGSKCEPAIKMDTERKCEMSIKTDSSPKCEALTKQECVKQTDLETKCDADLKQSPDSKSHLASVKEEGTPKRVLLQVVNKVGIGKKENEVDLKEKQPLIVSNDTKDADSVQKNNFQKLPEIGTDADVKPDNVDAKKSLPDVVCNGVPETSDPGPKDYSTKGEHHYCNGTSAMDLSSKSQQVVNAKKSDDGNSISSPKREEEKELKSSTADSTSASKSTPACNNQKVHSISSQKSSDPKAVGVSSAQLLKANAPTNSVRSLPVTCSISSIVTVPSAPSRSPSHSVISVPIISSTTNTASVSVAGTSSLPHNLTTSCTTSTAKSSVTMTTTASTNQCKATDLTKPKSQTENIVPVSSAPVSSAPVSSTHVNSTPSSAPVSGTPVSSTPSSSAPVSSTSANSTPVLCSPVPSTRVSTPDIIFPIKSHQHSKTPPASSPTPKSSFINTGLASLDNTFLITPQRDTAALTTSHSSPKPESSAIKSFPEEVKLDNFLFDTKPSERISPESSITTTAKPRNEHILSEKPVKRVEPQLTAMHQLPKTISQSSKPYSVARSVSVSSHSKLNNNIIQTTKISTLIPKSNSVTSKSSMYPKSSAYPSTINNVPSPRAFLNPVMPYQISRPELAVNGSSEYDQTMSPKGPSSMSVKPPSHSKTSLTKHAKEVESKAEKTKTKSIPPLTIPKSTLVSTTLKLQRSPGSTDHYIFAPHSHYSSSSHSNGDRPKPKEKHAASRTTSSAAAAKRGVYNGERQRVPTIKISDINRNPIIVESGSSAPLYRNQAHSSPRLSMAVNGRNHSRTGSDSSLPNGTTDRIARDSRRPSQSELLLSQHWRTYQAADLLFNGFKLPAHGKFHDLHYDTDAMPLDYSQSSSKS